MDYFYDTFMEFYGVWKLHYNRMEISMEFSFLTS